MPDQWRRALLRAALREVGYDAVGTRNVVAGMKIPPKDPGRGGVKLIVVDQDAIDQSDAPVDALIDSHGALSVLIARSTIAPPPGRWQRVLSRPLTIDDIVAAVGSLLPLPAARRHPVDT
jgi:hypothetical protein